MFGIVSNGRTTDGNSSFENFLVEWSSTVCKWNSIPCFFLLQEYKWHIICQRSFIICWFLGILWKLWRYTGWVRRWFWRKINQFSVTPVFEKINRESGFSKLWTDFKRTNFTHFKLRDQWTDSYFTSGISSFDSLIRVLVWRWLLQHRICSLGR